MQIGAVATHMLTTSMRRHVRGTSVVMSPSSPMSIDSHGDRRRRTDLGYDPEAHVDREGEQEGTTRARLED
jgi:hypothetical protein